MMLVTLEEAANHLRIDLVDDYAGIETKVKHASAAVLDYIQGSEIFDSSGGLDDVPESVKAATLLMVGYLYDMRMGDPNEEFQHGYLPRPVVSLLYPYRVMPLG